MTSVIHSNPVSAWENLSGAVCFKILSGQALTKQSDARAGVIKQAQVISSNSARPVSYQPICCVGSAPAKRGCFFAKTRRQGPLDRFEVGSTSWTSPTEVP
jgi:hypothetical protein